MNSSKIIPEQSFPEQSFPEQPNQVANQRSTVDIAQLTIDQLKALAYDQVVLLEQTRQNIALLQAEIAKRK